MKKLKQILQSKYIFKVLALLTIMYSLLFTFCWKANSKYNENTTNVTGIIVQYDIDGNKLKMTLKGYEKIIIYYYFKNVEEKNKYINSLELGMTLKVKGTLSLPKNNTIPNGFNYRKYLKYHKINYFMNANDIKIKRKNVSVFYYIKNKLIQRIDKIDNKGYLRTFILGDKRLMDSETLANYQNNGISHLFSISGMHVSLITGFIMIILNKVSYSNYYKYGIIIPILIFYLFLTDMGASILRTVIMFIIFAINKTFNLKIKRLDLMLVLIIIAILVNPFILQDIGFQFSYIISFTLIIFYRKISKVGNKYLKSFYTSFICFLVSLPICIYNFFEINILSIILNVIMVPIVSIVIFPIVILTFIFPFISPIYRIIITIFEYLNVIINEISIFKITLSKPSLIICICYYILIYLSIWNLKYIIFLSLFLFLHKNYVYLDSSFLMTVLDVGQGDAIFIKLPNNKGNILVDTGGKIDISKEEWKKGKNNFSIAENSIIPYIKSKGINRIDYLIITHGDYDHMGESKKIIKKMDIGNVIFNKGEYNKLESDLIKKLNNKGINYSKSNKYLKINKYTFTFLNQTIYKSKSENDNSNIIYFKYKKYKFLLMGDASKTNENEIIKKYKIRNISFLKVGHHGSNTSSGKYFINNINPFISLISVGKNNRYKHPSKEVIDNLKKSIIFRTDEVGSIEIKIYNKYFIKTYAPYQ